MPVERPVATRYLYRSHVGRMYFDKENMKLDLLCIGCGLYDIFLGEYETAEERNYLKSVYEKNIGEM